MAVWDIPPGSEPVGLEPPEQHALGRTAAWDRLFNGNGDGHQRNGRRLQFMGFYKNFIDTFSLQGYAVYIAGESYAYVSALFIPTGTRRTLCPCPPVLFFGAACVASG